jgi:UDP-glucose 4-epimerase
MKGALVVGGAGYIGSHMVLQLKRAGVPVFVLDNLSRGHADAVSGAELFIGDLRNPNDIRACLNTVSKKIDTVFHFAALAYVGESVEQPALYYQNNVVGSINLFNVMMEYGIKKLVFSSTCATYGQPDTLPITESTPQNPINPYGWSKFMVERILDDYATAYGFKSISLRYFNAAGCDPSGTLQERHDPETHLIPLALKKARAQMDEENTEINDLQLKVFGSEFNTKDGTCIRDYVHVNDLCEAHIKASARLEASEKTIGVSEYYNLCNGVGFSVLDVIKSVENITGANLDFVVTKPRPGDPGSLIGSSQLANLSLGWSPQFCELDAIIKTAWLASNK